MSQEIAFRSASISFGSLNELRIMQIARAIFFKSAKCNQKAMSLFL